MLRKSSLTFPITFPLTFPLSYSIVHCLSSQLFNELEEVEASTETLFTSNDNN